MMSGPSGTAAFFAQHGFPGWTAYPVFAAEVLGGTALILGIYTRVIALALVPRDAGSVYGALAERMVFRQC